MSTRDYFYLGNQRALTSLYTGQPFFVDTNDITISTWIIRDGVWEAFVADVLLKHASGGVFVDCGANMGYYTILLGPRFQQIFSFEPNPVLCAILRENVMINALSSKCHVFQSALGSAKSSATLVAEERTSGGGHVVHGRASNAGADPASHQIAVERLDDVLPQDTQVDVMKVDVEGTEPDLFEGAWSVIDRSPSIKLVVELSPGGWRGQGSDPVAFLEKLARRGFRFTHVVHEGEVEVTSAAELVSKADALPYLSSFLAQR